MRMVMQPDKHKELCDKLQALEPCCKHMQSKERDFVEQTIEREQQYSNAIYFSDAQWRWLDNLHEKYVK